MAAREGVAFVCEGGGRAAQMVVIAQALGLPSGNYILSAYPGPDTLTQAKLREEIGGEKRFYFVRNPMMLTLPLTRKLRLAFGSAWDAFRLVMGHSFDVFVGLGSSLCVPIFAFAKLKGTRCIFIESYIRIDELSLSGRIVYWLRLADRLYVRHAPLKRKYPRAVLVE